MFRNDYSDIAHKNILEALIKYSDEKNVGYGLDKHSINASDLIKKVFDVKNADIHFLTGGTQANMTVITHVLRHYEGVICADTGHINVHETAAVEGAGYKIYTVKNNNGKVLPADIERAVSLCNSEHMVKLSMVYISNSTETGSLYTLSELKEIRKVCNKHNLLLFLDGARLGVALTSEKNDIKPTDLGKLCDAFYIGGTKNGLTSGEAVVLINDKFKNEFRYHVKNKGAMLAKGFVLGIEFEEAFKNNLYFDMAKNSNDTAKYIREKLTGIVSFAYESYTNQQFITLKREAGLKLMDNFGCEIWEDNGDYLVMRIVTSFKTTYEECDKLIAFIKEL